MNSYFYNDGFKFLFMGLSVHKIIRGDFPRARTTHI